MKLQIYIFCLLLSQSEQGKSDLLDQVAKLEQERSNLEKLCGELKQKTEQLERRAAELRAAEEKRHQEELLALKKTNAQLKVFVLYQLTFHPLCFTLSRLVKILVVMSLPNYRHF